MTPHREIPQRELRNDSGRILEEVAAGRRFRVTVRGRPVADLVPVSDSSPFVPRGELTSIIQEDPLDEAFLNQVHGALASTIDEL